MSAALTAQPGLHSTATAVSAKAKVNGKNKKRKKSTMAGGACATPHGLRGSVGIWAIMRTAGDVTDTSATKIL